MKRAAVAATSDGLDGWAATAEEMAATDAKWFVTAFALCAAVEP